MLPITSPEAYGLRVKTPDEVRLILAELRRRLEDVYRSRLRGLYLFGSYARGEASAESDLDVLIVLDEIESYSEEISRTSHPRADLSLDYETSLNTVFTTEAGWRSADTPFLKNVRREGQAA